MNYCVYSIIIFYEKIYIVKERKEGILLRKIEILPYQSLWSDSFQQLKTYFQQALSHVKVSIEHIGSTSVAGLPSKPIIDVLIISESKEYLKEIIQALEFLGYSYHGNQGIEDREVFKAPKESLFPTHHLYVSYPYTSSTKNHLTLRNHLRNHPDDRDQYGKLKLELATSFPYDIDSYIKGKTNFILKILSKYSFNEDELNAIRKQNT